MNLHHRHEGQVRSRQVPIHQGRTLDEESLFDLAKDLLTQIIAEGRGIWPCANLSLSVGGFEDGVKGNMGIGAFLVKGEEAEALRLSTMESRPSSTGPEPSAKKRRAGDGGIQRFFSKRSSNERDVSLSNELRTSNESTSAARTLSQDAKKSLSFATKSGYEARHESDLNSHQSNASWPHASAHSNETYQGAASNWKGT